jgi:L-ascorbate metabolism protein UlaG (beta-lactamase superfamily)
MSGVKAVPLCILALAAILPALHSQVQPPVSIRVPDGEKPSKPFLWSERRLLTAPELFDAPDEWIDRSLQWVDFILDRYRPSIPEHPLRRAALTRMDDILHIESAPRKELVQKFFRGRMERVIADIENTKVTSGMRIWKLYNHGFLVRTATVSFTFDVVPGVSAERAPGFAMPKELLERLVRQSDATFISHLHGDHANQDVVRIFLAQGKPVIAPDGLWKDVPEFATRMTYPERSTTKVHRMSIRQGSQTLSVVAYPGHQSPATTNNVNLVMTPEKFIVVQTGDQSGNDTPGSDFDWLAHIARDWHVDVLMPNVWTKGLDRIVRGVNPSVVITGHENEMGHTVDHREDYTQTYTRMYAIPYPLVLMTWGESWLYETGKNGLR